MESYIRVANGLEKADVVLKNAQVLSFFTNQILTGDVAIVGETIVGIGEYQGKEEIDCTGKYVTAGLIDAHMHIESTMATPLVFSKYALPQGTTGVFIDPHEIVNVVGLKGLDFILSQTALSPIDFYVMMPSSVPATSFDHNGAGRITAEDMAPYLASGKVFGLAEVMRLPEVLSGDKETLDILALFEQHIKDGHAPGLHGKALQAYKVTGIDNDHEAENFEEALEKLQAGFKVLIREGSAARNLEKIVTGLVREGIPLENCMFCTDDKHLDDIQIEGHINLCVRKAIALGVAPIEAYKMASYHTARSVGLKNVGAIAPGYKADILVLKDLATARPTMVMKSGKVIDMAALQRQPVPKVKDAHLVQTMHLPTITANDLALSVAPEQPVIALVPYSLITKKEIAAVPQKDGVFQSNDTFNKIAVIERHHATGNIGVGILSGFHLKNGAIASSVSHDAHNVTVVGDNDQDMLMALQALQESQGGLVLVSEGKILHQLPLPLAGVMSLDEGDVIIDTLSTMIAKAHALGIPETVDPFMTLSFLALAVIPEIRITDKGMYDVSEQRFLH